MDKVQNKESSNNNIARDIKRRIVECCLGLEATLFCLVICYVLRCEIWFLTTILLLRLGREISRSILERSVAANFSCPSPHNKFWDPTSYTANADVCVQLLFQSLNNVIKSSVLPVHVSDDTNINF